MQIEYVSVSVYNKLLMTSHMQQTFKTSEVITARNVGSYLKLGGQVVIYWGYNRYRTIFLKRLGIGSGLYGKSVLYLGYNLPTSG